MVFAWLIIIHRFSTRLSTDEEACPHAIGLKHRST
jgi:hypothetical protein